MEPVRQKTTRPLDGLYQRRELGHLAGIRGCLSADLGACDRRDTWLGQFLGLHASMLRRIEQAKEDMCALVLPALRRILTRLLPDEDRHLVESAIDDALLTYLGTPDLYDARRGHPLNWLSRIALNRAKDARRRRIRRLRREVAVGLRFRDSTAVSAPSSMDGRRSAIDPTAIAGAAKTDAEKAFLLAWLAGRSFGALATALQVQALSRSEQQAAVQRAKVRLRKRAKGLLRKSG